MKESRLVLAGGGHSHALLLKRWAMRPELRPSGLIMLISRQSTLLYSGMVPGLIAGNYLREEMEIDLNPLCLGSGVAFIRAEIIGIDLNKYFVSFDDRESISFDRISIDVGSEISQSYNKSINRLKNFVDIKPLENSLDWLMSQDGNPKVLERIPFQILGGGMTGVEVSLALRRRWPNRKIVLNVKPRQPNNIFKKILRAAAIELAYGEPDPELPTLCCTGNKAPTWLKDSGLPVNSSGRIKTSKTLQVLGHKNVFAVGDCSVIDSAPRPQSGVWAVKAANILARNLELCDKNLPLQSWNPQSKALQLVGFNVGDKHPSAWGIYGRLILGPNYIIWLLKKFIDKRFMRGFQKLYLMKEKIDLNNPKMFCRGCAAKLPSKVLSNSLNKVGLGSLGDYPEDCALVSTDPNGKTVLQSVDGFPAVIADPWLNGRITALHASSDLWSSGAYVSSAQAQITLPAVDSRIQEELLIQSLAGIQSALELQDAKLIGGHTQESREYSPEPCSLGISIGLTINGFLPNSKECWLKGGVKPGDNLLLSRPIGSGVLLAGAMRGVAPVKDFDNLLLNMTNSQHIFLDQLLSLNQLDSQKFYVNACTDVTGFGLLGHLGEMIKVTNQYRHLNGLSTLKCSVNLENIPAFPGSLDLLKKGISSTLSPQNRYAFSLTESKENHPALIILESSQLSPGTIDYLALLELILDPQTCGPLLVSCPLTMAERLLSEASWIRIGYVNEV